MTQNKARKAAVRARMAETGEPYSEAARQLDASVPSFDSTAVLDAVTERFGIPGDVLTLGVGYFRDSDEFPVLGVAVQDRIKVYLDVKDWVALAKARLGRPESSHDQAVYEALQHATKAGRVIVPLTSAAHMEISRISSLRQRTDLANVVAEISGFVTITGRSIAVEHQMRTALAARFGGPEPEPIRPFGLGVMFASGSQGRFVLRERGGGPPPLPDADVREIEATGRVLSEYMMVRGPEPGDLPQLRALGYRPEAVAEVEEARVKRERELAELLKDGTTDRGRLTDIVHARYLYWELRDHLLPCLTPYGITIEDFFANGKDWLTALLEDIPSAAINITLSDKGFRNSYKEWTGNDMRDADAVSAAIPYCDVVMTDKYVAAQLRKAPAIEKLGTLVLSRLRDLAETLPLITSRTRERNATGSPV